MKKTIGDLMTRLVVNLPSETSLVDAARAMRDGQIGDVVVTDGGAPVGLATDRDIVIRAIAIGKDPVQTPLAEVVSRDLVTVPAEASISQAAGVMREHAVRRLLVTGKDGNVTGVVSIGDLAMEMDPASALAVISGAPAND